MNRSSLASALLLAAHSASNRDIRNASRDASCDVGAFEFGVTP